MIVRIIALGAAFSLFLLVGAAVQADVVGGEDIVVPGPVVVEEEPVAAAPPPYVTMQSTSIAAGLGISWGDGNLLFEGRNHRFSVKGLSLIDLGVSRSSAEGHVRNLHELSDFEGHYLAVEAGVAAGVGASALTMRNEHGVVITLLSDLQGVQLTLGTEGFSIALE